MTNQTVELGTQKVGGLESVEGMQEGSTFVMETRDWKHFLIETRHSGAGQTRIRYGVDVNGHVKLHPIERDGQPYSDLPTRVNVKAFERVDDNGRAYVLVPYGGIEGGIPDEVQSHPLDLELFAAYDGFKLLTRARTRDRTAMMRPTHEPASVMAKYFPEGHRKKREVETLVRAYVTKGL